MEIIELSKLLKNLYVETIHITVDDFYKNMAQLATEEERMLYTAVFNAILQGRQQETIEKGLF